MARIHRRNIEKNLSDPDNHDGLITHLQPDISDCKLKCSLGSITMNKASGYNGIPAEQCHILKDECCCTQYTSKVGKLSSVHKGLFSFPPQRKIIPKNVQTTQRLLLNDKTLAFLASGGDELNLGPETRLGRSELLCSQVLLKYEGDREGF